MQQTFLRSTVMVAAGLALASSLAAATAPASAPKAEFVRHVDLTQIRLIAVQHDSCYKTFDTLARSSMRHMSGTESFQWDSAGQKVGPVQDAAFTYLDILFRPNAYRDARIIYVKEKLVLDKLITPVKDQLPPTERDAIFADQRVSLTFLTMPEVQAVLDELSRDIMRTAKKVNIIFSNAQYSDPRALQDDLRIIPPEDAESQQVRWLSIRELLQTQLPADTSHAGMAGGEILPGMTLAGQQKVAEQWNALQQAWMIQDAAGVNAALGGLSKLLHGINPQVYPAIGKLSLEHIYYKYNKLMWTWAAYFLALIFLLMYVVYRWRTAMRIGVGLFLLAFALHTAACGIRWYLAGRIPNTNMFEAVTAAAWFGCAVALCFELGPWLMRRRFSWMVAWALLAGGFVTWLGTLRFYGIPVSHWQQWSAASIAGLIVFAVGCMAVISLAVARQTMSLRGVPLFAASAIGMIALMCGQFMKVSLDSDIGRAMPILNDLWLYVHTNMIIASYALIGLAFFTAALYLVGRMLTMRWDWATSWPVWLLVIVPAIGVPMLALPDIVNRVLAWFRTGPDLFVWPLTLERVASAWAPFAIVLGMFAVAWVIRLISRRFGPDAAREARAAWEGTSMPAVAEPGMEALALAGAASGAVALGYAPVKAGGAITGPRGRMSAAATAEPSRGVGLAKVFDGATMLLLHLSFIMLWTGIIMGAIWADHSWGRPWGWDPKEVFALNTWIIFLILVHVRLKVVDKELWTAVLTVVGASVMMFNWVVVNFFIVGLHSYA